ncbi:MAG: glycosyl hydrolase family 2, partial [Bacteroidota bacterium]|nr:glycosyl hydrolase family 2 [Bacteroidota bacterium]
MKKYFFFFTFVLTLSLTSNSQTSSFTLAPLFTDSLVLQQKSDVPIWGKGTPGVKISVAASWGKKGSGIVQPDSNWMLKIKTPKAGGPFTISFSYGDSITVLKNILIGEVWLCSGQSNMEIPLEGWPPNDTIANSANEIQQAHFPKIRMFMVQQTISTVPNFDCIGSWKECTPEAAAKFSATAYYFGRKLFQELKVPIGLIQSTWGG